MCSNVPDGFKRGQSALNIFATLKNDTKEINTFLPNQQGTALGMTKKSDILETLESHFRSTFKTKDPVDLADFNEILNEVHRGTKTVRGESRDDRGFFNT